MNIDDFKVSFKVRTNSEEPDYFGYINEVSLYKYILKARVDYWDLIGPIEEYKNTNIGPIMIGYQSEMKKPIKEGDEITIYTKVDFIGKTSYHLSHCVIDTKGDICTTAKLVFVGIDLKTYKKTRLSKGLIKRIEEIEGKNLR